MKKYFILFVLICISIYPFYYSEASSTDSNVIKSNIDKASSSLEEFTSKNINSKLSEDINSIEAFRTNMFNKASVSKAETKLRVEEFKKADLAILAGTKQTDNNIGIEDATERPIAYLKLFFLSILLFILGSTVVFYLTASFIIYLIIRKIFRKIRNR